MITSGGVWYTLLNAFLIIICFVYIAVRCVLVTVWWCVSTPVCCVFYFGLGVKNFVLHGEAAKKEETDDFENLFNRRNAPSGPKREEGQGFLGELPATTEEAINRLLSLAKTDAYSILGVTPDAAHLDIRKMYRQQAILVHPDKTSHPGADAAFKILVSAFETVGDVEKREEYDKGMITPEQFAEDIDVMMRKLSEMYSNTLQCAGCNSVHKIKPLPHKLLTRYCEECVAQHAVKNNQIWAETKYMGLHVSYYACRNDVVYNVSDWIMCQELHIVPDTHMIQAVLRSQTKTFDDILNEWKNDPTGKNKNKNKNKSNTNNSANQPTKSRRSRKKRKK